MAEDQHVTLFSAFFIVPLYGLVLQKCEGDGSSCFFSVN